MNLGNKFSFWNRFYNNTLLQKIIIYFLTVICLPLIVIYSNSNSYFTNVNSFIQDINTNFRQLIKNEEQLKNSEKNLDYFQKRFNDMAVESNEAVASIKNENLLLMILSLILGGLLTTLLMIKLNRHFTQFREGFQEIRKGNLAYKIAINSKDEFAKLAGDFNEMTQDLKKSPSPSKPVSLSTQFIDSQKKECDGLINDLVIKQQELNKLIHLNLSSPESPEIPEIQISGKQNPKGLGGYYFFIQLPEQKLGFIMLESDQDDIVGHFLINFIMLFSKEELPRSANIRDFYKHLNQRIQSIVNRFNSNITGFFSIIDLKRFTLTFVNSGFKNPVYFSNNGKGLQFIFSNGSQLLGTHDGNCKLETLKLNKGDKLLLINRDINEDVQKRLNKIKTASNSEIQGETSIDDVAEKVFEIIDHEVKNLTRVFFAFKNQSTEKNDKNAVYFEEGTHYFLNKQYELALEAFNKVRGVDSYHIKALSSIGFIHYKQKDYVKAKDVWEEVLKLDPNAINIKKNLEVLEKQMEEETEVVF